MNHPPLFALWLISVLLIVAGGLTSFWGLLYLGYQPFGLIILVAGLSQLAIGIMVWRSVGRLSKR